MPPSALGKTLSTLSQQRTSANNMCSSASAAKDAVGDKMDESKHDAKGEAHKQAI